MPFARAWCKLVRATAQSPDRSYAVGTRGRKRSTATVKRLAGESLTAMHLRAALTAAAKLLPPGRELKVWKVDPHPDGLNFGCYVQSMPKLRN